MLVLAFNFWESTTIQAQDSNQNATLRFSLITCDAGEDIYTIWGHTAIRVVDSMNQTDIVYNYGSFDFNTPNFSSSSIAICLGKYDAYLVFI